MSNIVLVCIGNFQDYILQNIDQLLRLEHSNIFILTHLKFFENFFNYTNLIFNKIQLIDVDHLKDSFRFFENTSLDKKFRNGFWTLASLRFFYIYEFMKTYNIENVIHLENDVLLYYNCDSILDCFDKNYIYLPFDTFSRNIASIMYIPSVEIFKSVLDHYNFSKNDMENFSIIKTQSGLIQNLPIFPTLTDSLEHQYVTSNYDLFKGYIFDAAAIGQYLGGVDPRNISGDTTGFINETCIIKYNTYSFRWVSIDNIERPFLMMNGKHIPIFNLHIHSKNLERFI